MLKGIAGIAFRRGTGAGRFFEVTGGDGEILTGRALDSSVFTSSAGFDSLIHPDDLDALRSAHASADQWPGYYDAEYRIRHASGLFLWVWERGTARAGAGGQDAILEGVIFDIGPRRKLEARRAEMASHLRRMFENAIEGMFRASPRGGFLEANRALARIYGYDSADQLLSEMRDPARRLYVNAGRREELISALEEHESVEQFESEVYRRDGSVITVSENARIVRDDSGRVLFYEGMVEDVTARTRYAAALEYQAKHDALTGLPNRVRFRERLVDALEGARAHPASFAVLFLDLDQFKFVNDTLGHSAGDDLLALIGTRLRNGVPAGDTVARQGGDEFVLLLEYCEHDPSFLHRSSAILDAVRKPCQIRGREINVTCSIGIAVYPMHGQDPDTLMGNADWAMYRAKELGRDALHLFSAHQDGVHSDRLEILSRLHRALERQEFRIFYEPKLEASTRRIVGAEALLRWQTPEGLIAPNQFIPLAEETGLIVPIGEWVLRTVCEQIQSWQNQGLAAPPVSVNLSRRQLLQADIPSRIASILEETGIESRLLEIEVTESIVMQDLDQAIGVLKDVRSLGVKVALDDFGTGYSSLSCLKRLPLDSLKIDQSFLRDLASDPSDSAIIRAVVSLGQILNLQVVAEGVETKEQLDFLVAQRCEIVQGHYFAPAMPPGEFATYIARSVEG